MSIHPEAQFEDVKAKVVKGIEKAFPVEGSKKVLAAKNVKVLDDKDLGDYPSQLQAKNSGRSWAVPVVADLELKDRTSGRVLDLKRGAKIADLPRITDRYSYIVGGNEYQIDNIWRRKPGVYSRVKENGELQAEYNLAKGKNFEVVFDPKTRKFNIGYENSKIPLYPVLKAMGISDEQVKKKWGSAILEANKGGEEKAVKKFNKALGGKLSDSVQEATVRIANTLGQTELSPETTEMTLGKAYSKVSPDTLFRSANRLLGVSKGEYEPDDRDALKFKTLHGLGDLLNERIEKGGRRIGWKIRNNLDRKNRIDDIYSTRMYSGLLGAQFTEDSLAQVPNQTNPIDNINGALRSTILGAGGIGSEQQVIESAKAVNPSHVGFMDTIYTPEGSRAGIISHLSLGLRKDGTTPKTLLYDLKRGKHVDVDAPTVAKSKVVMPDQVEWKEGKPRPKGRKVRMLVNSSGFEDGPMSKADFLVPATSAMFGMGTNLVPFLGNNSANRISMAARNMSHALPLAERDAPLVQSQAAPGKSWDELIGKSFSLRSKADGRVTAVTDKEVRIKTKDGKLIKQPLYHNFPLNMDGAFYHHEPKIKRGDEVKKGDLLADLNHTKDGTLAIGKNLYVGFLPMPGKTFEDGIVVSQRAAKALTSEQMYRYNIGAGEEVLKNKKKFQAYYPTAYTKTQLDNLDDDGVVKPGTKIMPGDPILLGLTKKPISLEGKNLARLHKSLVKPYSDKSQAWDKETPGEVVDVVKGAKETKVHIKTTEPAVEGDKLCFDEATEVLTSEGWKSVADITLNDAVCCLGEGKISYENPSALYRYPEGGRMYHIESQQVDLLVTEDHRMYVRMRDRSEFELLSAREIAGTRVSYAKSGRWEGVDVETVELPSLTVKAGQYGHGERDLPAKRIPIDTYLMLLGAFLADGNLVENRKSGTYGIDITKVKSVYRKELIDALGTSGVPYTDVAGQKVRVHSKQLLEHFRPIGKAADKFIPRWVLMLPKHRLEVLLHWLADWGDGYTQASTGRVISYSSVSKRLVDDVQQLCLHIGKAANVRLLRPERVEEIKGRKHRCRPLYEARIVHSKLTPTVNHGHTGEQSAQTEEWLESYDRPVFCLTVPTGVLYVRRNGKPVFSGNCGRFGNKGIVSTVLDDVEMPRDGNGKPFDVLLSPYGVPSRQNIGQIYELAAAKIAQKQGKPMIVPNFATEDTHRWLKEEMKKAKVSEQEDAYDPKTGKHLGKIMAGPLYLTKLEQKVESKFKARAGGPGYPYDINRSPRRGGPEGGQSLSQLDHYALLASGAKCFLGSTQVAAASGKRLPISDIVRNRRSVEVLSCNPDTQEIEQKAVVGWSVRVASPEELVEVRFFSSSASKDRHFHHVKCTKGHQFYTPDGKRQIGDMRPGDFLLSPGTVLHPLQRQMLLGTLLGDGTVSRETVRKSHYSAVHGSPQKAYCEWKHSILHGLVRQKTVSKVAKGRGSYSKGPKYRFFTKANGEISEMRRQFYPDGVKIIPQSALAELTEVGLAFWFMDDGTVSAPKGSHSYYYREVRLCTNAFTEEDCLRAAQWFKSRWGIRATVGWARKDKKQPLIRIFNKDAERLLLLVAPYIHPCMQYKLKLDVPKNRIPADIVGSRLWELEGVSTSEGMEACRIVSISPYKPKSFEDYLVYNIEVEGNHNYFANGVLVGNSILREAHTYKSDMDTQDELWRAMQLGEPLPTPKVPFVYKKFENYLRSLGVDIEKNGNTMQIVPVTDKAVKDMAAGEIKNALTFRAKDLQPEPGGIFDPAATKGLEGDAWSMYRLPEVMPNPLFEKGIQAVTGLSKSQVRDIVAGDKALAKVKTGAAGLEGGWQVVNPEEGGLSGGEAIKTLLDQVDVDKEIGKLETQLPKLNGQLLDKAHRRLRYLKAVKSTGMKPSEAYMMRNVPVMPPQMRPVMVLPTGDLSIDNMNELYRGVVLSGNTLKDSKKTLPEEQLRPLRKELYDELVALSGIGAKKRVQGDDLKGVLQLLHGDTPKSGYAQSQLIARRQDLSARSTITPNPSLGLDEVGVPKKMAMTIYKPFVVRELNSLGYSPLRAQEEIKKDSSLADTALKRATEKRPVLMKRDPVLHKYGIQAFKPKIVGGKAIQIHPLITGPFGADFDGDLNLNQLLIWVSNSCYLLDESFWDQRRVNMSARFKEQVAITHEDGTFAVCNLRDFPHDGLTARKGHIDFYSVLKDIRVVALDEQSGKPVLAKISNWSTHKQREIEIVTLGSGRQIITDDDERAVYGVDASSLEWCRRRPSEAKNQFVPVMGNSATHVEERQSLKMPEDPRLVKEIPLCLDTGWFFGFMAGNGWGDGRHMIGATSYPEVEQAWTDVVQTFFKSAPTFYRSFSAENKLGNSSGSGKVGVSSMSLSSWIDGLIGKYAPNKHLPPFTMAGGEEFKIGLLAGLWDSDGSVSWSNAKNKPQFLCSYTSTSLRLVQEIQHLLRTLSVSSTITTTTTPKGGKSWILNVSAVDYYKLGGLPLVNEAKRQVQDDFLNGEAPDDSMAYSRYRLVPLPAALGEDLRKHVPYKKHWSEYTMLNHSAKRGYISKKLAERIVRLVGDACTHPLYPKWKKLVETPGVHFERVKAVEKTGIKEDGYDLTVPGYETFMSVDGIILSNTMALYTPISNESVKEAWSMMPSNNLFSPSSGRVAFAPTNETVLGLYKLTRVGKGKAKSYGSLKEAVKDLDEKKIEPDTPIKVGGTRTTAGRATIYDKLPAAVRDEKILTDMDFRFNGKGVNRFLYDIGKKKPEYYSDAASALMNLGNEEVYERAHSYSLDDFAPDSATRDKYMKPIVDKMGDLKPDAIIKKLQDVDKKMSAEHIKKFWDKPNNMQTMVQAGVKPAWNQYKQIVLTPVMMEDAKGNPIPNPITRSWSEGVDTAGMVMQSMGARSSIVRKTQSVSEPGALSKRVANTVMDQLATQDDCGTKAGIELPVDDPDVVDRYLSSATGGFSRGTLVTPEVLQALRKKGVKSAKVRSPSACETADGICSTCFGIAEHGHKPPKGTNLGVRAGQAIGERSTQLMLKSVHFTGASGSIGSAANQFDRVDQLLKMPKKIPDAATLATKSGKITKVQKDPAGGYDVEVDGIRHYVPQRLGLLPGLKQGSNVKKGQQISRGAVNVHDLLPITGIHGVRKQIADELGAIYGEEGVRRRNVELVARGVTNLAMVKDPGDKKDIIRGDYIPISVADKFNSQEGRKKPVKYEPILKGVNELPHAMTEDWLARLNHTKIKDTLMEAANQGWISNMHSNHPVPALAQGYEFGKMPFGY